MIGCEKITITSKVYKKWISFQNGIVPETLYVLEASMKRRGVIQQILLAKTAAGDIYILDGSKRIEIIKNWEAEKKEMPEIEVKTIEVYDVVDVIQIRNEIRHEKINIDELIGMTKALENYEHPEYKEIEEKLIGILKINAEVAKRLLILYRALK